MVTRGYLYTAGRLVLTISCILLFGIFDKWSLKVWFVQIPSQTPLVLVRTTLPALINHYKKIFIVLEKALRGTKIIKLILLLEVTKLHLCDTQVSLYYLSLWRYNHILVSCVESYYWFPNITSCVFWTSNSHQINTSWGRKQEHFVIWFPFLKWDWQIWILQLDDTRRNCKQTVRKKKKKNLDKQTEQHVDGHFYLSFYTLSVSSARRSKQI